MGLFNLDRSAKAIIAGVVAIATAIAAASDDGVISNSEKALAVAAGITAAGAVWAFANPYVKAVLAALVASVTALAAGLADDAMSTQEWVTMVVAGVLAFGAVMKVDNTDSPPPPPVQNP